MRSGALGPLSRMMISGGRQKTESRRVPGIRGSDDALRGKREGNVDENRVHVGGADDLHEHAGYGAECGAEAPYHSI